MGQIFDSFKQFVLPKVNSNSRDLASYIDLEMPCLVDRFVNITRTGKRLTIIKVDGYSDLLSSTTFAEANNALLTLMKRLYRENTIEIAWSIESDPHNVIKDLNNGVRAGRNSAKVLGIDDSLYFDDVIKANIEVCTSEDSWIAVWTSPKIDASYVGGKITPVSTESSVMKNIHAQLVGEAGNPFKSDASSIVDHQKNVKEICETFFDMGCVVTPLPSKIAASFLNEKFNASLENVPSLHFIDDERMAAPGITPETINTERLEQDFSRLFVNSLSEQISRKTLVEDDYMDGVLTDGKRFYATHTVDVAPKSTVPFSQLRKLLKGVPYRITFIIKPKRQTLMERINQSLNTFGRAAEANRDAYRQFKFLRYVREEFEHPTVQLQMVIVTWSDNKADLIRYSEYISTGLITWSDAAITFDNISPWQTFASSIAGINATSYAESWLCDPDRLVHILPHQKSASMIKSAPIILRDSLSGEPLFYGPQLKEQDYDLTLYLAKPRQGKSLLMNDKGISNLVKGASEGLNLLGSLDIGPNAAGAFQLARIMLSKKHGIEAAKRMVAYHKWDPAKRGWYVNPLDIGFGQTHPTPIEKTAMISFYSAICCEPESGTVADGVTDLLSQVIDIAFDNGISERLSTQFNPLEVPIFDEVIKKHNLKIEKPRIQGRNVNQYISFFELRDMLFQCGELVYAQKAHLYAVPTVTTLLDILNSDKLLIEKFNRTHETLVDKVSYSLSRHMTTSEHLTKPTTLDFQDARMISFDLLPLTAEKESKAGTVRLFSEYILAMSIVMKNFTISDSLLTFKHLGHIYHDYWRERINQFANLDKVLNLDEWHMMTVKKTLDNGRTISQPIAGAEYVDALIKQAPKWRVSINIATHSANDLTQVMRQKATNIFFYSGFTGEEANELKDLFSLSDHEVKILSELHGPQANVGTEMLYIHYINNSRIKGAGRCVKRVEFLCAGSLLWALNTSADDLPHKLRLERDYPQLPWLNALIEAYPNGSMSKERGDIIEMLKQNRGVDIDSESIETKLYAVAEKKLKEISYSKVAVDIVQELRH